MWKAVGDAPGGKGDGARKKERAIWNSRGGFGSCQGGQGGGQQHDGTRPAGELETHKSGTKVSKGHERGPGQEGSPCERTWNTGLSFLSGYGMAGAR